MPSFGYFLGNLIEAAISVAFLLIVFRFTGMGVKASKSRLFLWTMRPRVNAYLGVLLMLILLLAYGGGAPPIVLSWILVLIVMLLFWNILGYRIAVDGAPKPSKQPGQN